MARIATFDLLRFRGPALRNLARVAPTRAALRDADGLVLGRFLGTAAGSSTAGGADLNRWALVGVWEDAEAATDFWALDRVAHRLRDHAIERWSATLVPIRGHGRWAGIEPFAPADHDAAGEGEPVAVLTRATVRPRKLRTFHAARGPVDRVLHATDGLVADVGMGEWPIGQQATFSLWRDDGAVRQFARDRTHAEVVGRTRREGWYAEELFAAFRVVAHGGRWDGRDPLAPTVRLAQTADLAFLNEIERAAASRFAGMGLADLDDALDLELLREGQAAGRLWVADHAGAVVGFALATVVDGEGFLREIDVVESHGRRGIGGALFEAVCAWARTEGHRDLTLTTFRDVPWNEPWYARLGFRFVPEAARGPELQAIVAREAQEGLTRRTVMRLALPVPTAAK